MEDISSGSLQGDEIYMSDSSESDESSVSCSTCYSNSEEWMEQVRSDGSLFYMKARVDYASEDYYFEFNSTEHSQNNKKKSKSNPAEKLIKWLKARKKRSKSIPSNNETHCSDAMNSYFNTANKLSDLLHRVIFVDVDPIKVVSYSSNKTSLAEMLFGLKLGHAKENYSPNHKLRILAIRRPEEMPDIKIGDKLLSVNGIAVTMTNLEDVLKNIPIPSQVKLEITLSKSRLNSQLLFHPSKHYDLKHELEAMFCNEFPDEYSIMEHIRSLYEHVPHGVFFLSFANGMPGNDVIYSYPGDDSLFFQLKGVFLTLGNMISDVASPPLLSCSVKVLNDVVHVAFVIEEDNMMLLALPAAVASVPEVQHFSIRISKFLKYLFSSLQKAFTIGNTDRLLDNFFSIYFEHTLSPLSFGESMTSESHLMDILPSVHWFPLSPGLKTEVDDILSELESADFGIDSKGFKENRRLYNIVGSCLYYKGYLLCSHLQKDDLLDIHLFLHSHHLLELSQRQPIPQVLIWKEVFPSKYQENKIRTNSGGQEFHGRWFMLIVMMQHSILAVLLDDSEGCVKHKNNSPPEPFYVEEVYNTLWIFHHYGIMRTVERALHSSRFPADSRNSCYDTHSENSLESQFSCSTSISSSGPNVSDHSSVTEKKQVHADDESDSESSCSNEMASMQNRFKSLNVTTQDKNNQTEGGTEGDENLQTTFYTPNLRKNSLGSLEDFEKSVRKMANFENHVFYYLHMDPVEGVFIAPVTPNSAAPEILQKNILSNFYKTCLHMRTVFERSMRNGEINQANIVKNFGTRSVLQNVAEQGLLFKCNETAITKQKNSQTPVHFWVIGRLFFNPEPREIYVCHQDGVLQDIVEMSFHLAFGLSF